MSDDAPTTVSGTFDWVRRGAWSIETASEHVHDLAAIGAVDPGEVSAAAQRAQDLAQREGEPLTAVNLIMLARAAVRGLVSHDNSNASLIVAIELTHIDVVHAALASLPDRVLFDGAVSAGEMLAEFGEQSASEQLTGEAWHRLGTMILDAYTAGKPGGVNFLPTVWHWRHRLAPDARYATRDPAEWLMPPVQEALPKAEHYLRRAAALRSGSDRARTLKAWAQALVFIEFTREHAAADDPETVLVDPPDAPTDIDELLGEALALADASAYEFVVGIMGLMAAREHPPDPALLTTTRAISLDGWVKRLGRVGAADAGAQLLQVIGSIDPASALDYSRQVEAFARQYDYPDLRRQILTADLRLLGRVAENATGWRFPDDATSAVPVADEVTTRAQHEEWDPAIISAALLTCAARAQEFNEEFFSLALVDRVRDVSPVFATEHADMIRCFEATLYLGVGSNAALAENWPESIAGYTEALRTYLELAMAPAAREMLMRTEDVISRPSHDAARVAAVVFAPVSLNAELGVGEEAVRMIQRIAKRSLANLASTGFDPDLFLALLNMAKGQRFAAALTVAFHTSQLGDDEEALLAELRSLETGLTADEHSEMTDSGLPAGLSLATYIAPGVRSRGTDVRSRIVNLRRRFDELHETRIATGGPSYESLALTVPDIQAALDARTALLHLYVGATPDGQVGVYTLLVDRDGVWIGLVSRDFPDGEVEFTLGDDVAVGSPLTVLVDEIWDKIGSYPGTQVAPAELLELFEHGFEGLFGHLVERLPGLRERGIDHLCVVPHGPLHFYPFHLLGEGARILADDFVVTYLPSLHLLARRGGAGMRRYRPNELTALGLSFAAGEPHGQPPLASSGAEVRSVAAVFGSEPVLDSEATEAAFLDALQKSRRVHLSTHGHHDIDAPSFQSLLLAPTPDSDGVLNAYELTGLDLRGVELVTLSACETALGRFDRGDNLRGIPAALFRSGVETVVGTLWEAEANASELFFTAFYRDIAAGSSRLDAFRSAQLETREAYPQYRDWAPFYLMGDWS